jgi:ferrous iron transport protein A
LRGGRQFGARLAALGLTCGAEVTVIQNDGRGPLIVLVRDSRVALGHGEALKVWVEAAES